MTTTKVLFAKSSDKVVLTAKISPDNLKLFIDAERAPGGHAVLKDDLIALLDPPCIAQDLDHLVLDDVAATLSRGEKATDRRIKKGQAAEPGHDGKLLLLVKKFTGTGEIKTDEKGYGSLTERHLFDNILIDQVLGRLYPAKPGKPGLDAMGKTIPAPPGKPFKLALDKTIRLEQRPGEEFETIVAQQEGFLVDDNGKLSVREELVVTGDLDLRFGSLDCIGKVRITGSVASGLKVRAKKGITIGDGIQESILECPQGDIVVRGYGFGGERGRIVCGGNVQIRVAQELRIEALRDIVVDKEAVDCILRTQTQLQSPNGKIVGGDTFVVCGLEVKNLGNEAGKPTTIHLCSDIETSTEFSALENAIRSHAEALKLVDVHLGPYATSPARIQLLKQPFRERMEKLSAKRAEILKSRGQLEGKLKDLLANAHRSDTLRVNALGAFYPGVTIIAGLERFEVKDFIKGPATIEFSPVEKKFSVCGLRPVVCAVNFEEAANGDGKGTKQDGTSKGK